MSSTAPDLASYDIILVNTSPGRDSQAALRVVAETARAAGVCERVLAVHCDLGRVEWEDTRDLAAEQAAHCPSPVVVCRRDRGDLPDGGPSTSARGRA